jgi:hypothetical protein
MSLSFCQTFTVKVPDSNNLTPNDIPGVYLTKVGLFFRLNYQDKGLGVRIAIFKTVNGIPSVSQIVPKSSVHIDANSLVPSTNSSNETIFTFPYPVYLQTGTEYGLCIDYDGDDPDFYLFTAKKDLATKDYLTNKKLDSINFDGNFFTSSNDGRTWNFIQNEYLKFNLYRASYNSGSGTVIFNPTSSDRFFINNTTLSNNNILPGADAVAFLAPNTFYSSSVVGYRGKVRYFAYNSNYVELRSSTGNIEESAFSTYPIMQFHKFNSDDPGSYANSFSSNTLLATANVTNSFFLTYNSINAKFAELKPPGTNLSFDFKGMANGTFSKDSNYTPIRNDRTTLLTDKTRVIPNSSYPGLTSTPYDIRVTLTSNNDFVSPTVDNIRAMSTVYKNQIDSTKVIQYSDFFNNGGAVSKYISKPVTLAPGQDASDLKLYMTAHRPANTDLRVFVKFLSSGDSETLNDKEWTPLNNNQDNYYTDVDESSVYEYQYTLPSNNIVNFTDYAAPFSSNLTISSTSNTVIGNNTEFYTSLRPDFVIYATSNGSVTYTGERRRVTSINSNNSINVDSPFSANITFAPYYLSYPLTVGWYSNTGLIPQTGTLSTSNNSTTVNGTTTNFVNNVLKVGQYIAVPVTSLTFDYKRIISIANSTQLTVDSPFTVTNAAATFSYVSTPGLNYRNNDGSIYSKFKSFQIKVTFHADEPAVSPFIKDIRAIAVT